MPKKQLSEISARDKFILAKAKQKFSPTEIEVLLKREGFEPVSHTRIYQILEFHGVRPTNAMRRRRLK